VGKMEKPCRRVAKIAPGTTKRKLGNEGKG
jgi:hypothetical protein